jgi:type IV pilus assembly protein PilW
MNMTRITLFYYLRSTKAFTLVELMITMMISGVIISGVYSAYISQQRTYLAQEQVAEMQQNLRAATDIMVREIKMAGYDYTGNSGAGATRTLAGQMSFTLDINDDGDLCDQSEVLDFGMSSADDADRNGIPDAVTNGVPDAVSIARQSGDTTAASVPGCPPSNGGGYQAIADNIQAVEFLYILADGTRSLAPSAAELADIRSVEISILARAGKADRNFTNTRTYCQASNLNPATGLCIIPSPATVWGPFNDNFRRRLLITTVQPRNIGL